MKKILTLVSMIFVIQGVLLLGNYDTLNKHFDDLKITKKCLENSQYTIALKCDFLNREFQKYENIVKLSVEKEVDPSIFGPVIKMAMMGHIMDSLATKEELFNAVGIILSDESNDIKKEEFDVLLSRPITYTLTKKIE